MKPTNKEIVLAIIDKWQTRRCIEDMWGYILEHITSERWERDRHGFEREKYEKEMFGAFGEIMRANRRLSCANANDLVRVLSEIDKDEEINRIKAALWGLMLNRHKWE